jgi:hypothetical protein
MASVAVLSILARGKEKATISWAESLGLQDDEKYQFHYILYDIDTPVNVRQGWYLEVSEIKDKFSRYERLPQQMFRVMTRNQYGINFQANNPGDRKIKPESLKGISTYDSAASLPPLF